MPPVTFAVGETFERYEIESLIGRGGMGEVYRAVDTRLRRKVALKVLRPDRDNGDAVQRLFREARAAAGLAHPNTVAIHDIGESDGTFYIVMELVTGTSLLAYVGDDRVPAARKLGWLVDVARALSAAHKAGVIHRDVKPSNVMVSENDVVKVLDFGLAKPIAPVSFRTMQGHVLGTPRYMAPEQLAGADVDARSDQYAYGLTAYELVAGKHPGGAISGPVPAPSLDVAVPEVSRAVAAVIARTMATLPEERFASMDDVAVALEDAIAGRPPRGNEVASGAREPSEITAIEVTASKAPLADTVRLGLGSETPAGGRPASPDLRSESPAGRPLSTTAMPTSAVTTKRAGGAGAAIMAERGPLSPPEGSAAVVSAAAESMAVPPVTAPPSEDDAEENVPTATARTAAELIAALGHGGDFSPRATTLSDPEQLEHVMAKPGRVDTANGALLDPAATVLGSPSRTLMSREKPTPLAQPTAKTLKTPLNADAKAELAKAKAQADAKTAAAKAAKQETSASTRTRTRARNADASGPTGLPRSKPFPRLAIALVVLGACAFAGAYYGSKELAQSTAPAPAAAPPPARATNTAAAPAATIPAALPSSSADPATPDAPQVAATSSSARPKPAPRPRPSAAPSSPLDAPR